MFRRVAIGIAIVVVLIGCSAGSKPVRQAVIVTGEGISKSRPFVLEGDYVVNWTATPHTAVGCYHGASLKADGDRTTFEMLVNETINDGAKHTGATRLYDMAVGSYYVDASSGCDWAFTFAPS